MREMLAYHKKDTIDNPTVIKPLAPTRRPSHISDQSNKLDQKENTRLCEYFAKNSLFSQATAVVQLYLSEKPDHKKWTKKHTGVLCFIKDYNRRSFFFHIYNLNNLITLLWEQEFYKPFKYNRLTLQFHYFDTEDCIAGLNFSCDNEALKFYSVVCERIKKREEKMNNQIDEPITSSTYLTNTTAKESKKKSRFFNNIIGKVDKLINKNEEKKMYSKLEIGAPQNFEHKQHIGSDGQITLNDDNILTCEVEKILSELKIKSNKKNHEIVKEIIEKFFNVEDFKKEIFETMESEKPKIPKLKIFPSCETIYLTQFDDEKSPLPSIPPPMPSSAPPPLPPYPNKLRQAPTLPTQKPNAPLIQHNRFSLNGPPLPPLPAQFFPTTDHPVNFNVAVASSIEFDKSIEKFEIPTIEISKVSRNSVLLDSIKSFSKEDLRPVDTSKKSQKPAESSMRSHLLKQLEQMRAFIQDSENEEDETDDDEWQ